MNMIESIKSIIKNIIIRRFMPKSSADAREYLAIKYLIGSGIEIGALCSPLSVPYGVQVKYVDRLSVKDLRSQYPELKNSACVEVDIIDDGQTLTKVPSDSCDFVIANHFLEHCEDPISAIKTFLRVLKTGGVLYMAVPDKRYTFDAGRPVTALQHIVKDHEEGPALSRQQHLDEWRALVDNKFKDDPARSVEVLKDDSYSIHFHVWTYLELMELMAYLRDGLRLGLELREFVFTGRDGIFIIEKT